jgi:hypothetical protein
MNPVYRQASRSTANANGQGKRLPGRYGRMSKPASAVLSLLMASGEEAVTLLKGHKDKYPTLVTDINLHGKMDWEVAQFAREIDPGFPIVYMSGAAATCVHDPVGRLVFQKCNKAGKRPGSEVQDGLTTCELVHARTVRGPTHFHNIRCANGQPLSAPLSFRPLRA